MVRHTGRTLSKPTREREKHGATMGLLLAIVLCALGLQIFAAAWYFGSGSLNVVAKTPWTAAANPAQPPRALPPCALSSRPERSLSTTATKLRLVTHVTQELPADRHQPAAPARRLRGWARTLLTHGYGVPSTSTAASTKSKADEHVQAA